MPLKPRAIAVRTLDLNLLPKTSPIYHAFSAMQVRAKTTAAAMIGDRKKQGTPSSSSSNQATSSAGNVTLPQASTYTTGLSRLREHYTTSLQEDIMITTYQHHHKVKKQVPAGTKVEMKGNKHIKPAQKASSSTDIPELIKIDVHCMMKEAITSKYNLLSGIMAIQSITGETPEIIFAKKGVHNWKLRKGMPIGCRVTLKGDKMYQFLDKLVEVVLPKMKEWPGLPEGSGDGTGNIGMGFPPSALSLFPEIESNFDMYPRMTGFDITFNTTAYTNLEARLLMSGFNMPFQKSNVAARKVALAPAPEPTKA
ncbi:large subunit ribosomal protein L5 [Entomortierella parvispora]|uniref:Large ribosomal subunit protein uL5m n=1 Tax=Entomortierella parvispora TaxID=205924 RepID=A0A9P3H679_9FUNG|nr:large subunit ribosomal protein L5 [Entomortierella parvispora]